MSYEIKWVDKPGEETAWPKMIYCGDLNLLSMFIKANWPVPTIADFCREGDRAIEGEFLAWLSEWYSELYEEFKKVLEGKAKFDALPKYDLKEV